MMVLVLISSTFTFASDLFLTVNRSQQVVVEVNNQKQTNKQNSFKFYNLSGGNTFVKIYDKWTGMTLFQNTVSIPVNYLVTAELDNFGNMNILSSQPLYGNQNTVGTVNYGNNCDDDYDNNYGNNNGYGNNKGHHNQNGNYNQNNKKNKYFDQFLAQLKDESFDSNRLKTAKSYLLQNKISAEQVKQIAELFSFDSYRLDWAKAAYSNCYDKGNYFLLKSVFSFDANYNSLVDYISKQ